MSDIILGISEETTSNASLFIDGKPVAAIAQERLNRKKFAAGFPDLAINEVLRIGGVSIEDVDTIVVANKFHFVYRLFPGLFADYQHDFFSVKQKLYLYYHHLLYRSGFFRRVMSKFNHLLVERKLKHNFLITDHHTTHAYSAYMTSGFDSCLSVTIDNMGDGLSCGGFICEDGRCRRISAVSALYSPGQFYGEITQYLGFDPLKHAGKITGLAAYGDSKPAYEIMAQLFGFDEGSEGFTMPSIATKSPKHGAFKRLSEFSREEIAAAAQQRLEDVVLKYIKSLLKKCATKKIALAGGVFGNVKLNQRIFELEGIDEIFIHPGMSDCGLSMGAVLMYLAENKNLKPGRLEDLFLGPSYDETQIKSALDKFGLRYERPEEIEVVVARLLAEGRVVARFDGRMEYGPRALGNRSILYRPDDVTVNDWLNEKLDRTEFMPFAPVTLAEFAEKCYKTVKGLEYTAKFMTIAVDCTDFMKETSPGVVHVDGTARPQLLSYEDNPAYYRIIKEYHKITGVPGLINTSFNMHEEPIVCSPDDAIRAFLESKLDYLAIGSYLVPCPQSNKR